MASVGEAAARGLESGLGIGMRLRAQQRQEDEFERQRKLQDEQLAQQREDRARRMERDDEDAALKALDSELETLRATGEGYAKQYGQKVPDEIGKPYAERVAQVSGARNTLLRKRYAPIVQQREQEARDLASRLQTNQVAIEDVPDDQLARALTVMARRPLADFMAGDGAPSRVQQSVTDVMTGLKTGNEGMLLRGANVLLEPELKVGVGEPSPYGGKIVGKRIAKFLADPNDPSKVLPVVKVYVSKGRADSASDVARMERIRQEDPDAPDGATGYYIAPVTENRSSDPNDPIKSIDLQRAMQYAAQMQTLGAVLNRSDVRAKIERGGGAADDFLQAFYSVKGKMPGPDVEWKTVVRGGTLVGIDKRTGKEVSRIEGPAAAQTGLAGNIQAIEQFAEENGISFDEAAAQLQARGLTRAPAKGRGASTAGASGGGVGLGKPRAGTDQGVTGDEFLATLSADDARIVKGVADGRIKASDLPTNGGRREQVLSWVAQYKPETNEAGKTLPEPVRKVLTEARDNASTMERMLTTFKPEYAGKGVLGLGADLQLDVSSRLGIDNPSVQWWKNYRKQAQLVERHAMFGASLTQGEQAAWAAADISPGMDPSVIEENLRTRAELTKKVLEFTRDDMISAGHSQKRITEIANRGAPPPDTDERKSGEVSGAAPAPRPAAAPAAAPRPPVRTATNPQTGERLMLKDGRWVPMQ